MKLIASAAFLSRRKLNCSINLFGEIIKMIIILSFLSTYKLANISLLLLANWFTGMMSEVMHSSDQHTDTHTVGEKTN